MSEFTDLLQNIVNESTETKVSMAAKSLSALLPTLRKIDEDNKGMFLMSCIFGTAASADGTYSMEEIALIGAIFKAAGAEMSDDKIKSLLTTFGDEDCKKLVTKLAGALNQDDHANLVMLVAAICSIDDTIKADEVRFIKDLL